jgi:multicomponent Na+:H+ antiporter subunit B
VNVRSGDHLILRVVGKFLVPFVLLFALYVQFHGDYGPGGGFQAGVIFAAGLILHCLLYGVESTTRVAPPSLLRAIAALGVLLYAGTGVAGLLLGANYLDYDVLGADPVAGQHLGILLVELGVGLTVAAVMLLVFFTFAARLDATAADAEEEER